MTHTYPLLRRWLTAASIAWAALGSSFAAEPISGAGATFPYPIYARWASEYREATGVEVTYAPVGSGKGTDRVADKLVDFGASDVALAPGELGRLGLVQFPAVVGGVVPVVNITGIRSDELKLTGQILADIYLGKVRKWNDHAIVALNPGIPLPSSNITVVHRSDSSGTTFLWSDYLSRSSPEWGARVGTDRVLKWPVGVADIGNEGVASSVQRTKVSIGYVEYAYAKQHNLGVVSLRNREGRFVKPSQPAFEAALLSASWQTPADLDQPLIDPPGAASWPIVGATYIFLPGQPSTPTRTREVMRFFEWAMTRAKQSAVDLDYVPLPDSAVELIEKRWAERVRSPDGESAWSGAKTERP